MTPTRTARTNHARCDGGAVTCSKNPGPRWAAVGRSPEAGARKRRYKDAGAGYVCFKGLQVGRFAKCGAEWNQGQHKQAICDERWEDRLQAAAKASM